MSVDDVLPEHLFPICRDCAREIERDNEPLVPVPVPASGGRQLDLPGIEPAKGREGR
jgi:hypothetical protein